MQIKRRKVKKEKAKKNKDTFCTESSLGCRRGGKHRSRLRSAGQASDLTLRVLEEKNALM